MRIVTVDFVTVIELIAPSWTNASNSVMYSLFIKITSSFVGSANRHRSPCRTPLYSGYFIISKKKNEVKPTSGFL